MKLSQTSCVSVHSPWTHNGICLYFLPTVPNNKCGWSGKNDLQSQPTKHPVSIFSNSEPKSMPSAVNARLDADQDLVGEILSQDRIAVPK